MNADATERAAVDATFRNVYGQAVATLVRVFGDIELAEDAVQDAFIVATERWSRDGVPVEPAGWIVTTARRKAIDRLRRRTRGTELQRTAALEATDVEHDHIDVDPVKDDLLRLMFTCCHPALRVEHQIALTLRLLGGLEVGEIARSFLVTEAAMAKRLVRAKYKIKEAGIPYRVPDEDELAVRLDAVLGVVYLIFSTGVDDPGRSSLRHEAIRLGRALVELMPDESEVAGLLSLMLSSEARATARSSSDGIVVLRDQDRTKWDQEMITEASELLESGISHSGPYWVQAAIQMTHNTADSVEGTDWQAIVRLYDLLHALTPTPIVALNRAIALGEASSPESALAALDDLGPALDKYPIMHAARATMLRRTGDAAAADQGFNRAALLARTEAERRHFLSQISQPAT